MGNKEIKEVKSGKIGRRRFLGISSVSLAGLALSSCQEFLEDFIPDLPPSIPPATEHRNIIVIGSGFGGAISAMRLTEAGKEVTLLERGKAWKTDGTTRIFSKNVPPDRRATWLSDQASFLYGPTLPSEKYIGVLEANRETNIDVLAGAGYGGGSIVWGGIYVKPDREIYDLVFPAEIPYDELENTYFPRAMNMMRASQMPADIEANNAYKYVGVNRRQVDKIGLEIKEVPSAYNWDFIREEFNGSRVKSATIGESVYGIASGAKIQLDETYLKQAENTGRLEVKLQHVVREIGKQDDGKYWIYVEIINERGRPVEKKTYTCNYLFMAAGTMGTSKLMIKAKAKNTIPNLNEEVGRGFGNNGNTVLMRERVNESVGAIQGSPSPIGTVDYNNPITPLFVEHTQFPIGFECECLNNFALGINPTRGHFVYDPFNDEGRLIWPRNGNALVDEALLDFGRRMNDANGGFFSGFFGRIPLATNCFHPCGGMVLGKAADFYGRVKNHSGLYVVDGSMMPGSGACVNPSLTISALAERNIEAILNEDF